MYKKPCCDNYVEAIRSVIARVLVDKKYKYSETHGLKCHGLKMYKFYNRVLVDKKYKYSETSVIVQVLQIIRSPRPGVFTRRYRS